MNKEELKTLVKKYFNLTENTQNTETNEEVTEQAFVDATLVDGTKIHAEGADFEVGQELHVVTEAGERVVAPSGEHTTESGIVLTVDGDGIITGVHKPDESGEGELADHEEMAAEEETSEEEKTELAEDEVIEEVTMEDGDVKEAIVEAIAEAVMPEIEALKSKMAEIEEAMKEHMSAPAAQPTVESKFAKEEKSLDFLNSKYDFKKAQLDAILNKRK